MRDGKTAHIAAPPHFERSAGFHDGTCWPEEVQKKPFKTVILSEANNLGSSSFNKPQGSFFRFTQVRLRLSSNHSRTRHFREWGNPSFS